MWRSLLHFLLHAGFFAAIAISNLNAQAASSSRVNTSVPSSRYALGVPAPLFTIEAEGVDRDREILADQHLPKSQPLRYAVTRNLANAIFTQRHAQGGEWRDLADGMALWRIPVHATNALSLDFGFRRFFLPPGAQLFIHNAQQTLGPYTDADNPRSRRFFTPLIVGERAQIEVLLPQAMKRFLELDLDTVHVAYRNIFAPLAIDNPQSGSGACNVDTICPQGDLWRREVNAAAVLVFNGGLCSGQLVNNTRGDHAPLLTAANHCIATQAAADNLVVYWKYESPTCRIVGSAANALPISTVGAIAQLGGAKLLATHADSDISLLQLNSPPPANANAYFNGWDISTSTFADPVVIHHPQADAKRISFGAGTVTMDDDPTIGDGIHHWRVDHYSQGTTQVGSSGAGLLDLNHHLRGVLSNGYADCSDPAGEDYYGRLDTAWQGGGTPDARLRDWLDPTNSGVTQLDGQASCTPPDVTLTIIAHAISSNAAIAAGDRIQISASASGGTAPYHYAFDVDGDGIADSTDPDQSSIPAVYSGAYSGNVSVAVTDSTGCTGTASRALIVQAPQISPATLPLPPPGVLCGGTDFREVSPGQRRQNTLGLINTGNATSQSGFAIFAQDPSTLAQTKLTLETPSVAIPALAPGETTIISLDYAIDSSNACGAPVKIDFLGSADDRSFSSSNTVVVDDTIASDCQVVTTCPAVSAPIQLDSGSYYDARRPGTGMTVANVATGQVDPTIFAVWFTGDAARQPTWYVVQSPLQANQVNSALYQSQQSAIPAWPLSPGSVGSTQITLVDTDKFVFTWNFDTRVGGALYTPVTSLPSSIRIGYNPAESGWGIYDQLVQTGGSGTAPLLTSFVYLFDGSGLPRWLEAGGAAYQAGDTESAVSLRPACPGCVWLDYTAGMQPAGTMVYSGAMSDMQISTNLFFPAALSGRWTRTQLPLNLLYHSP